MQKEYRLYYIFLKNKPCYHHTLSLLVVSDSGSSDEFEEDGEDSNDESRNDF
jgi:hypothetical protein